MAKNNTEHLELIRKRARGGDVDCLREALQALVEGIIACPVPRYRHAEVSLQICGHWQFPRSSTRPLFLVYDSVVH